MSVFIDRERELKALRERYQSGKAELLFLYGRSRVGKSRLIERFLAGPGVRGARHEA